VGFCEGEWPYPWAEEIVGALATGWPCDSDLKRGALERMRGIGFPKSWAPKTALDYLLKGCPGDDDVAHMLADNLGLGDRANHRLIISDCYRDLLGGFAKHPVIVPAAETWLEKNDGTSHLPLEVAVIAKLGGTPKCRLALLDWLRRGDSMPAWIISTLLEMSEANDPEVHAVLSEYIQDEQRRSEATRWLPDIIRDSKELGVMLRNILRDAHVYQSSAALAILVEREGRDAPDLWQLVETRLSEQGGHYWRLAHHTLLSIWPEHALIRQLAKSTVYAEDMSVAALYDAYGSDSEIRPLLDGTMRVLHEDLRLELARAMEPLVRRGTPSAVEIVAKFINEPNGEARTVAARAFARAVIRKGSGVDDFAAIVSEDLTGALFESEQRRQAAVAALLELGRADLVAIQREYERPLELSTYSNSRHNWEFVAVVVEHWETLAEAMPDIWARLRHSPIIATELAKAGKGRHALGQTEAFENAVRAGQQLEVEDVKALIALHGRSSRLRDLFLARLQHFLPGSHQSMMVLERPAYHAMASYLADNFHGDAAVGQAMLAVANTLIHDVALVALCRGWPEMAPIAAASARLPTLIEADEPVTAWLFASKADAALMAKYLLRYPSKLMGHYIGEPRDGIEAVRARLQMDRECRELLFAELQTVTEPDTWITLTKLLAPSMGNDPAFRSWMSDQLRVARESSRILCQLAFDVLANAYKPVEFALFEAALTQY
jgi:hypothetical protein